MYMNQPVFSVSAIALFILAAASISVAQTKPGSTNVASATRAAEAPVIDGDVLGDPAWAAATPITCEVEALRSLVYRACEDYLAGVDVTMLASMAKLKAGRLRREVSDACLQYWGGAGYLWDSPVARSYRDGRLGSIGGGADEVMLQIISKLMGTLPRLGNL